VCSRRRAATARPEGPAPMIRMSWRGGRVVLVVLVVLSVGEGKGDESVGEGVGVGGGIVGVVGWLKLLV
jgi:hypothetical protein